MECSKVEAYCAAEEQSYAGHACCHVAAARVDELAAVDCRPGFEAPAQLDCLGHSRDSGRREPWSCVPVRARGMERR